MPRFRFSLDNLPKQRELELLLCGASAAHSPHFQDLVQADLDWDYLYDVAHRHGVLPLLQGQLRTNAALPAVVHERVHRHFRANAARNLLLGGELLRVLRLFEDNNIIALPFKGPTLAVMAYGSLALREFGDLDLLVPAAALQRAKALLVDRGYRVQYELSPSQEAAYLRTICQLPLERADGCIVELHSALMPRSFCFPLGVAQLWQRRVQLDLLGQTVAAPSAEDSLLILCAHGAKHLWKSLGWICDVAELLRARPHLDWATTLLRARSLHGERMLLLGLCLAWRVLDVTLPTAVQQQVERDRVVAALAHQIWRRLFDAQERPLDGLASARFHLQVRERLGDGIGYCLSLALEPTLADWSGDVAPAWLPFGGYLRRPLRLVGKYGRTVSRTSI